MHKSIITIFIALIIVIGWFVFKPNSDNSSGNGVLKDQTNLNKNTGNVVEIDVVAERFSFSPNPIRVNYGDRVRLKIKSKDVTHGFALPDFNINKILNPGEITIVEFVADKKGRFGFYCSVPCGVGHAGMTGNIIVQ